MRGEIQADAASGVVEGRGELDLAVAADLRAALEEVLSVDPTRTVVVDLRGVTFIDSTGLKELVRPTTEGRSVTLRLPSEPVRRLLELSGLDQKLPIEPA